MKRLIAVLLLAWSIVGQAQTVVPVYEEPFHRLVVDNGAFKILDILIPPGGTTLYHRHAEPTFYINFNRTVVRSQLLGDDWSDPSPATARPGSVSHNDDSREKPFEHRVNNMGDEGFRLMLISNDRGAPHAPGLDVMASMPGKPGIDSQYFTQSRIDLEPGERLDWVGVRHPLIFVLVSHTHVVVRSNSDKRLAWGMHTPGDFEVLDAGHGFLFENRDDETALIIALAVR